MNGGVAILFIFVAILAVVMNVGRCARSSSILEDWARENGYTLIESSRAFFNGPFFFTTSKSQLVYRIVVQDENGNRRSGYAKVGGYFTGTLSDQVNVRWD